MLLCHVRGRTVSLFGRVVAGIGAHHIAGMPASTNPTACVPQKHSPRRTAGSSRRRRRRRRAQPGSAPRVKMMCTMTTHDPPLISSGTRRHDALQPKIEDSSLQAMMAVCMNIAEEICRASSCAGISLSASPPVPNHREHSEHDFLPLHAAAFYTPGPEGAVLTAISCRRCTFSIALGSNSTARCAFRRIFLA